MGRVKRITMRMGLRVALFTAAWSAVFSFSGLPAYAAETYQAEVSQGYVTLAPGQTKLITLKFKNTGTATWQSGLSKTAVYLYGNSTVFHHASWQSADLPKAIEQGTVAPGAMASASFYVTAPSTPGTYNERFLLSYGSNLWVKGSVVPVMFTVTESATAPVPVETVPVSADWSAALVNLGGIEWQLAPSENTFVNVTFKNTGKKTWMKSGATFISLYTWGPKYRTSAFQTPLWKAQGQAGFLVEDSVAPGKNGTVRFELRAPAGEGTYRETFHLAAENAAWVSGGEITLPIRVGAGTGAATDTAPADSGSYQSILLLTSNRQVVLPGGGRIELTHGFKNTGGSSWSTRGLKLLSVTPELGTASNVVDASWPSATEAVRVSGTTKPGEIGFVTYMLKAPAKSGDYAVKFQLLADGNDVPGGEIEIPVTVTSDGAIDPTPIPVPTAPVPDPSSGEPQILNELNGNLPEQPIIRVGALKTTDDTMVVRGIKGGMKALKNGIVVCSFSAMQEAKVVYNRSAGTYAITGPGCSESGSQYYVLEAHDGISPLEMTDYYRPVSWLPGANDNTFRSRLELRYAPETGNVWVINELPIEHYLYGLAETSDVSPLEYQKALLTAARTYAMYHVNRGTKHADEYYTIDAKYDQVYRGYGQEARSPNIVKGIDATRGYIVTFDEKLAITPYFSRSDGRTRNWTEVWGGGGYPWLVSVPVSHDIGQTLWGHGVGLSARGALYMSSKDGKTYDEILKHFYQGVQIRRAYK